MEDYFYPLITLICAVESVCYYSKGCKGLAKGEKDEECVRGVFSHHIFVFFFFFLCTLRHYFAAGRAHMEIEKDITIVGLLLLLDLMPLVYLKDIRYSGFNASHFKVAVAGVMGVTVFSQMSVFTEFDVLCSLILSGLFVIFHLLECVLVLLVQCRLSNRFGNENMAGILMKTSNLAAFLSVTGILFSCQYIMHNLGEHLSCVIICSAMSIYVVHGIQVSCGRTMTKWFEKWCKRKVNPGEEEYHQDVLLASESLSIRLSDYFETEKPFLQPDLCLSEVSLYLMTNKTTLSKVLHLTMNTNFREFVNKYRVQEAVSLFSKNMHLDMEQLAKLCGFRNNSSFTTAFKLNLGMTPGAWCKEYKEKRNEIWKKRLLEDAEAYPKEKKEV